MESGDLSSPRVLHTSPGMAGRRAPANDEQLVGARRAEYRSALSAGPIPTLLRLARYVDEHTRSVTSRRQERRGAPIAERERP